MTIVVQSYRSVACIAGGGMIIGKFGKRNPAKYAVQCIRGAKKGKRLGSG
jgi:hypothetical protein